MTIRQITIIGSGTMGRGIAHISAVAGFKTFLQDIDDAVLQQARASIESNMKKAVEKGKLGADAMHAALGRIETVTELEAAARTADLIIEAVPENLDLKKNLLSQADLYCSEETILATNTSSLSVTELAKSVEKRGRFIGLHFFNPPHIMKLLEIVVGERTSEETKDAALDLAGKLGKEAIVVRDVPGFATSRLGIALGLEAIRMVEDNVAAPRDIDKAMELGYNHPMGPLRLTDLVGLDVRLSIAEYLATKLGERFEPPQLLRTMVQEGRLGKKSGRGFYEWSGD